MCYVLVFYVLLHPMAINIRALSISKTTYLLVILHLTLGHDDCSKNQTYSTRRLPLYQYSWGKYHMTRKTVLSRFASVFLHWRYNDFERKTFFILLKLKNLVRRILVLARHLEIKNRKMFVLNNTLHFLFECNTKIIRVTDIEGSETYMHCYTCIVRLYNVFGAKL